MKLLVATGGSPHSDKALDFAAQLARPGTDTISVVTVVKHKSQQPHAQTILAQARSILQAAGHAPQIRIRLGHPAEEIIAEAEAGAHTLVVVGEKQHHGPVTRFLIGATAERVVEHAPCPVVVAQGRVTPVHRLLVCDSGGAQPPLLERLTGQLSELLVQDVEVTILHVMSQMSAGPGVPGAHLRAKAGELIAAHTPEGRWLVQDLQNLAALSIKAQVKIRHGFVVDEVLAEAAEGSYDMLIIGTHRGTGWRNILLDDLAHQIIIQADRPVLVVR